jgi:anti-sigma factor RsiW
MRRMHRREIAFFQQLDTITTDEHNSPCFDSEELAEFIDGGGDPDRRGKVEAHLTACPQCRSEIIALYRGIQDITTEMAQDPASETPESPHPPEGAILTMPKRKYPIPVEKLPIFRFRDTGTEK